MNCDELRIIKWPADNKTALDELYENTDQSKCLVQLALPLDQARTRTYRRCIFRERNDDNKPFLCFAVMLNNTIIGKTEVTAHSEDEAELDIIIDADHTGRGYGKRALDLLHKRLKEINFASSVRAYVSEENEACIHLLLNAGYERGRKFSADILIPDKGSYVIRTVNGYEFKYDLTV